MALALALGCSALFVGNSFTFGMGSAVEHYRPSTVTDLNRTGMSGVPALFNAFAEQSGLRYDVAIEASPGKPLRWHLDERAPLLDRRWDVAVLQGYSTLDPERPGDLTDHVAAARELARRIKAANPAAQVNLVATWSRADQVYPESGHWHGQPVERMAEDVAAASRAAAQGHREIDAIVPVGDAWNRAMQQGIADPNPYDGATAGQVNLWAGDHYHASLAGSYLEALVLFGRITGKDPAQLGAREPAAAALGLAPGIAADLQRIARDALAGVPPQSPPCQSAAKSR